MLRRALRPALRLPWGLLCTSMLSSSDLRKVEGQPTAPIPVGLRAGAPEQGHVWMWQDRLPEPLRPILKANCPLSPLLGLPAQNKNLGSGMLDYGVRRKLRDLECGDNGHSQMGSADQLGPSHTVGLGLGPPGSLMPPPASSAGLVAGSLSPAIGSVSQTGPPWRPAHTPGGSTYF